MTDEIDVSAIRDRVRRGTSIRPLLASSQAVTGWAASDDQLLALCNAYDALEVENARLALGDQWVYEKIEALEAKLAEVDRIVGNEDSLDSDACAAIRAVLFNIDDPRRPTTQANKYVPVAMGLTVTLRDPATGDQLPDGTPNTLYRLVPGEGS